MTKKLLLLATAVTAVFALGVQAATANWYHGSTALKAGENPHLEATGTFKFTSANGGVSCAATDWTVKLTGGTTTGHVESFSITGINLCEVSGGTVFLTGGTTTLKSATWTAGAQVHQIIKDSKHHLSLTGVKLHLEFTNGFKKTLESVAEPITIGLGQQKGAIQNLSLTGPLNSPIGLVFVEGNLFVHKATYGVTPS